MSVRSRASILVLALAGVPLLGGCDASELAALRRSDTMHQAELQSARRELESARAQATKERASLVAELASKNEIVAELTRKRDVALAEAKTAGETAKKSSTDLEELQKKERAVASHRDELIEWVNELLPLAEKQDPRLANLREITDDIARQVEEYRGMKFKRPFMRRLIHRDEVAKFMRRDMEREMPKEEIDKMVRVMSEFGLVSRDTDIMKMFESFMEAGAAAFYKPDTGTFYLIEGKNDRGDRPIVFHELIHALEDQYFDLTAMQTSTENDSDAGMGIKGLIEGSAERMTNRYSADNPEDLAAMMKAQATPDMMQRQMKMMQQVPTFLIAAIGLYPYKNGAACLDALGLKTSADLDAVFASPPASTEQVLHPEKYGKDFPHIVAAPDIEPALGDGWEVLDDDSMGELFCGLLLATNRFNPTLKNNMPVLLNVMDLGTQGIGFKPPIRQAVEGWDGDRYTAAVLKDGDGVCVAWTSVWDSVKDAEEFAENYAALLGMRVDGEKRPLKDVTLPARFVRASDGAVSGVEVDGAKVYVVLSAPADRADAVFAATRATDVKPDPRDTGDIE